jgi:hypothetical protein
MAHHNEEGIESPLRSCIWLKLHINLMDKSKFEGEHDNQLKAFRKKRAAKLKIIYRVLFNAKRGGLQNMVYAPQPMLGVKVLQKLADLIIEMFKINLHPAFG